MFGFVQMPSTDPREFEQFWAIYPRKVGKFAAEKAFRKARARGVTLQELLQGVERYKANKPAYADYCHASTWLNAGRWLDEYETAKMKTAIGLGRDCPHEPVCPSYRVCTDRILAQARAEREQPS